MSTDPHTIPNGYDEAKHRALSETIASPGLASLTPGKVMACHESPIGKERTCTGWLAHQLGPGNNLALRLEAMGGAFGKVILDGPQHQTFEDTLP